MSAWRHRFLDVQFWVHANQEAIDIERASYTGGRVECWRVGRVKGGPWYKLDVNSMYPFVMSETKVPVRIWRIVNDVKLQELPWNNPKVCMIAECLINTEIPAYPVKRDERLCWPVGQFWTTLADAEFRLAVASGHVKRVKRVCLYHAAIIFDKYVSELYKIRKKFQAEGNDIFALMVKLMLNSLYGKFGQHSEQWVLDGYDESLDDDSFDIYDLDSGDRHRVYIIAGHQWTVIGRRESYHSFPGVASCITSAARVLLWKLFMQAGLKNVFYTDTDSLIVNREGRDNLKPFIDAKKLGFLKQEYSTRKLEIWSPKDYKTDKETHIKGVRKGSKQIAENVFESNQWEGLRGALSSGRLDRVFIRKGVKKLTRTYSKAKVHSDGSVSPWFLEV